MYERKDEEKREKGKGLKKRFVTFIFVCVDVSVVLKCEEEEIC